MIGKKELLGVVGVCLAVGTAFWWSHGRRALSEPERSERRAPALAALPSGAGLAVTIDFERVRQTELGSLLTSGGRELPELGSLSRICGFDPTTEIQEVAFAVPSRKAGEATGGGELGIAVTGEFRRERIVDCAARVIERRGGDPARSELDSFASVRDRRSAGAEIAVRDGGPILIGEGRYLREMIDAVEGKGSSLLGDEAHGTLRDAMKGRGAIMATWVAQPGWLERYLEPELVERSPLAGARAGALRVDVAPDWSGSVLLACTDASACDKLASWVRKLQSDLHTALEADRLEDPIRDAKVTVEANAVRATLTLDPKRTTRLLARFLLEDAPQSPAPPPSIGPDAVIAAPRDSR